MKGLYVRVAAKQGSAIRRGWRLRREGWSVFISRVWRECSVAAQKAVTALVLIDLALARKLITRQTNAPSLEQVTSGEGKTK
jgi:hypothetical protein